MSGFNWDRVVPENRKVEKREEAYAIGRAQRQAKEELQSNPEAFRLSTALEEAKTFFSYEALERSHREKGVDSFLAGLQELVRDGSVKLNQKNLSNGSLDVEIEFVGPDGFQEVAQLRSVVDSMVKADMGDNFKKANLVELGEMYKGMGHKARKEFISSMEEQVDAAKNGEDPHEVEQAGLYQLTVFANNESSSVYVYDAATAREAVQTIAKYAQKGAFLVDKKRNLN